MKVLLVGRPQLAFAGGGDKVVILKTLEYLRNLGVQAEVTFDVQPDYTGFDIAHLFTLSTWYAAKKARKWGIPFVTSPIYWDGSEADQWAVSQRPFLWRIVRRLLATPRSLWNLLNLLRTVTALSKGRVWDMPRSLRVALSSLAQSKEETATRKQVLEWSSCLMPGSETEMRHIEQKFGARYPYFVVPHGVERSFAEADPQGFLNKFAIKEFVLCATAGFTYRKNQLSLIRALKRTDVPLVLIGEARSRAEVSYLRRCKKESGKNVHFLETMSQKELASAMKAARVFAMPSLFETPGLVYLEAAAAGCNVVATQVGSAKEYLGDCAWYCNPYEIYSIKEAVLKAYSSPKTGSAQRRVLKYFTWERAAKLTLEVYQEVLRGALAGK